MNTKKMNLFIVDENESLVVGLKSYLDNEYGNDIAISTFSSGESALERIDKDTGIVIMDCCMFDKNGHDLLNSIKKINPKTEVVVHSSNESTKVVIDSFRNGAKDYIVKGKRSSLKIGQNVYSIITYPIRIMIDEWKFSKYFAIFILTFSVMAIVVSITVWFL